MAKKCNMNARIKYFNYQVLHRSIITNKKLLMFGLADSDLCERCGVMETIMHLLYDCKKNLWDDLEIWMLHNLRENIKITRTVVILGDHNVSIIANYIIIVVKHEIYKSKWTGKMLTMKEIENTLKRYLIIEEYVSMISQSLKTTLGK